MARRARISVADLAADRRRALQLTPVSRETLGRLDRFVTLLLTWQSTTNLVAASTVPRLWTRHIADSLQLIGLAPLARHWADLGTGAGFPGLIVACSLAEQPGALVHLIEGNAKKAAFLREAIRVTGAPAMVHAERIEKVLLTLTPVPQVLTARALAPLKDLLELCFPLLGKNGATGLFPKGQNAELELAEAAESWTMQASLVPSRTAPGGRILVIRDMVRVGNSH
jgi:16S rRNA (guanine527-N7)-methyltransferase